MNEVDFTGWSVLSENRVIMNTSINTLRINIDESPTITIDEESGVHYAIFRVPKFGMTRILIERDDISEEIKEKILDKFKESNKKKEYSSKDYLTGDLNLDIKIN